MCSQSLSLTRVSSSFSGQICSLANNLIGLCFYTVWTRVQWNMRQICEFNTDTVCPVTLPFCEHVSKAMQIEQRKGCQLALYFQHLLPTLLQHYQIISFSTAIFYQVVFRTHSTYRALCTHITSCTATGHSSLARISTGSSHPHP